MSPPARARGESRLSRYRAERLLRKDFAGLRVKVLAVVRSRLRGKGITLDPADLEACYAQAWHGLYATVLEGEPVENPSAWLVTVTFRRAIDEYRGASRSGVAGEGEMGSFPRESDGRALDFAAELDDRTRLRQVFEALRTRLSARECEAASLCYLQGLSRAEAAQRMNVSEARMRKLMEGAGPGRPGVAGKVGELLETIKAGGWCEQQSSLMRAYAFGVLDPDGERHALAAAHCRECPACRAHVASLRGLASVLPLPLLSQLALAGAGGTANAGGFGSPETGTRGAGTKGAASLAQRTSRGLRLGRVTGGWSGASGSLAIKLAITGIVLVGTGYAALGGHAHAGRGARVAHGAPTPTPRSTPTVSALSQAPFGPTPARTRGTRPKRTPGAAPRRRPRTAPIREESKVEPAAPEFGPEHGGASRLSAASAVSAASRPAPRTASRRAAPAAGEFGFE
jgi:RNA polymerase sigma factor (sigma-70 family)